MSSLVVYFSATGNTKKVAKTMASAAQADLYEIKPVIPYTSEDLDWMNKESRSSLEMKDVSSRPEIITSDLSLECYDTIYLGFPIWWYVAPTIINTFLESYDFSNKKIVLFGTSGGSGFGETVSNLKVSLPSNTQIIEGLILNKTNTVSYLRKWIEKNV